MKSVLIALIVMIFKKICQLQQQIVVTVVKPFLLPTHYSFHGVGMGEKPLLVTSWLEKILAVIKHEKEEKNEESPLSFSFHSLSEEKIMRDKLRNKFKWSLLLVVSESGK